MLVVHVLIYTLTLIPGMDCSPGVHRPLLLHLHVPAPTVRWIPLPSDAQTIGQRTL